MSKILYNQTASPIIINDVGYVVLPASPGFYTIPPMDYLLWAQSGNIVTEVGSGDVVVNDGSTDLNISDGIDLIKGLFPRLYLYTPSAPTTLVATLANTEYSQVLPTGTRMFKINYRSGGIMKWAYHTGTSTNYFTLNKHTYESRAIIAGSTLTLYFQSPVAGTVVELETWV
jgi:hypothetical protein